MDGALIFALAGVLLIVVFAVIVMNRLKADRDEAPEDQLSDEQFRKIEFGDDGP